MKKIYSVFLSIVCLCSIAAATVFALPETGEGTVLISRSEMINFIILAGAGIFLIGILFILLSLYIGVRKKSDEYDEYEEYDEETDKDEEYDDYEEYEEYGGYEDFEEYSESDDDSSSAEAAPANDEIAEDEADRIETDEPGTEDEIPGENEENKVGSVIEEENAEEEKEEDAAEASDEECEEQETERKKVRITLTGLNNSDVKVAEFAERAVIGRRSSNDIMISDNAVSGTHCEFTYKDEKVYIEDLGSTNGTVLNNERITHSEINSGDIIVLGKHKYRIGITE